VNFTIDKRSKTVYLYGKIDPQKILEKITQAGKKAEIIWSNNECKKPTEDRRNQFMEQCSYPSGSINAPNAFFNHHQQQQQQYHSYHQPNYYQQQGSYAPPNPMMTQFQPYHQPYVLPVPYTFQRHPQPPPPQLYTYHQNDEPKEPVAKSFPPTPPPPKNFTMGDLQCRIM
ncbi:hypothetical protein EUTSA_v10027550mg, partial [Eutrema salsugineum]